VAFDHRETEAAIFRRKKSPPTTATVKVGASTRAGKQSKLQSQWSTTSVITKKATLLQLQRLQLWKWIFAGDLLFGLDMPAEYRGVDAPGIFSKFASTCETMEQL